MVIDRIRTVNAIPEDDQARAYLGRPAPAEASGQD